MENMKENIFSKWCRLMEAEKLILPAIGLVLSCEYSDKIPILQHDKSKNRLSLACEMSGRMLDDADELIKPHWVLVPTERETRGTLKAIVCDKHREMWETHQENIPITSVRVIGHAKTGKAIIVEII